jgi:hypothetical protein
VALIGEDQELPHYENPNQGDHQGGLQGYGNGYCGYWYIPSNAKAPPIPDEVMNYLYRNPEGFDT